MTELFAIFKLMCHNGNKLDRNRNGTVTMAH